MTASPGQVAAINSSDFPVTAGAPFTVTFAARVSPPSAGSDYFTVMFVSSPDTEISRSRVKLEPGAVQLARPVTDVQGAFAASLGPLPPGSYLVEAWFRGGSSFFPSYARISLPRP